MSQLKHIQSTLGWFLFGLLLTYGLINVIGLASPFWGLWRYPGDPYASPNLLHFWQPITAWFSICFLVGAWHLAKTVRTTVARIGVLTMGALIVVAHVGSGFARRTADQADSPELALRFEMLDTIAYGYLGFVVFVFIALIWRTVRQSNNSFKPKR